VADTQHQNLVKVNSFAGTAFGNIKGLMLGLPCKKCASANHTELHVTVDIPFTAVRPLTAPAFHMSPGRVEVICLDPVFICPKLVVGLDCGFTEFIIPETDLRLIGERCAELAATSQVGSPVGDHGVAGIESRQSATDKLLILQHRIDST